MRGGLAGRVALVTGAGQGIGAAVAGRYAAQIPVRRVGRPEDIAAAVAFLVPYGAGAMVGQVLHPNGESTRAYA